MYKKSQLATIVVFSSVLIALSTGLSTKMLKEVTGFNDEKELKQIGSITNKGENVQQLGRPVLSNGKVPEVEASKVEHVGLFYNLMFGNTGLGFDFGHSFDAGANYKLPYYSDRQYLVLGTDLSLHLASFSWLQLITPIIRGSLNLELNGVKIVPSLRGLFDTSTYSDLCFSMDVHTSGLELILTGNVDILDCNWGLLGTLYELGFVIQQGYDSRFGQSADCDFRSYWFDQRPILRLGLDQMVQDLWWSYQVFPEQCLVRRKQAWEY